MSTLVNWNGQQYLVPAYNDTGYAQGNGNLSQYLVALSTGSLQQIGGLFQLTADADFGPNFGLVSSYYKSRSANIASAGVLRLANTDAIKWRNSDNSADVTLAMNATGTAARTYTIPDISNSYFVMTEGTQSINGTKTFADLRGTMGANLAAGGFKLTGLAAGSGNGDSLRYEQLVGAYLPLGGGTLAGNVAMGGSYKLTGLAAGTTNGDSLRYEQVIGTYALDSAVVHNTGTENVAGAKTFTTQIIGKGTVTNDSASAGYIGEYIDSTTTNVSAPTSGQYGDVTSISLTAGDWDISLMIGINSNNYTAITAYEFGISTSSGNAFADYSQCLNYGAVASVPNKTFWTIASYRKSLSSTTTMYAKHYFTYASGTHFSVCSIHARRAR